MSGKLLLPPKRPLVWSGLMLFLAVLVAAGGWLYKRTGEDLRPIPTTLRPQSLLFRRHQFLDRNGIALSVTYDNPWNIQDWQALHDIPMLLQEAVLASEDRRFYQHRGVDWLARAHALAQNLAALRGVRGASTITEQVVRILHPRPRTVWSRWLEGIEAARLEGQFEKAEILEFYLNQVPYGRQRRGLLQAARLYFDRDLDTLGDGEILTLAVLIRSPGRFERRQGAADLAKARQRLAEFLVRTKKMEAAGELVAEGLAPTQFRLPVDAGHFIRHLTRQDFSEPGEVRRDERGATGPARVLTTLDSVLQGRVRESLDQHLRDLKTDDVHDGAVLAVNHQTNEILAWVSSGGPSGEHSSGWIDGVTTPRQPGSTLKPFLYGLALDRGWTAATIIDDSPLARPVGDGMHPFRNYSRKYYGPLRLREALGNSLNIPAIRVIEFTGVGDFLDSLHRLGFAGLNRTAGHYGEGLALGNGEVTLLELVQGYTVLARGGAFHPLRLSFDGRPPDSPVRRVYSSETASLVADILSDPQARRREFGSGNILRFPVQTAVKTGTSSDHRDTWAIGFNHRYTVGIWMGNLDGHATGGLTGTTGPGLLLRSIFSELNRFEDARPLFLSPRLAVVRICQETGRLATPLCPTIHEKFTPGTIPQTVCSHNFPGHNYAAVDAAVNNGDRAQVHLLQPSANLQMAVDPHIPDNIEAYPMKLAGNPSVKRIEWLVDGRLAGITGTRDSHFLWPLARGSHLAQARVWNETAAEPVLTPAVRFVVK